MQFSIFHIYREIVGLPKVFLIFGAEFLFVLALGAIFLPNHWLGSHASVSGEVKSHTGRLASPPPMKLCGQKRVITTSDVRFTGVKLSETINLPDDDTGGGGGLHPLYEIGSC